MSDTTTDDTFTERGIKLFDVDDGMMYVGAMDFEQAIGYMLEQCGPIEDAREAANDTPVNLDTFKMHETEDRSDEMVPVRKVIRAMLEAKAEFPAFVCFCE